MTKPHKTPQKISVQKKTFKYSVQVQNYKNVQLAVEKNGASMAFLNGL